MTATLTRKKLESAAQVGKRQTWKFCLAFALAAVIAIVLLECLFTAAGIGEQEFLRPDQETGYKPMPGKHVTWRAEGFSRSRFNSAGLTGPEVSVAKPPGACRIAVLGDSMVQGLEVNAHERFSSVLEASLNAA